MTRYRLGLALLLAASPLPAIAQATQAPIGARVDRIEKELRAVQRKVFPGGNPAFFEAEIAPPATNAQPAGQPASAPLNDLTARVDGLEREVARLTGQVEQADHRLQLLSEQAAADRASFEGRLKALEATPAATPPSGNGRTPTMADEADPDDAAPPPATPAKDGGNTPARPRTPTATPDATAPAASGDPAEDAYMAGYRLWADKKYPEAEAALRQVVTKYPKHKRASYAQNLLGRALLDDGRPANAAEAFAANYQTNPRGERAPESLYYLGQSLVALKKPADACKVYDEFDAAYSATAPAGLKDRVATARKTAKCK